MQVDKFISNITKKLCISSNSELKRYIGVDVDTHPDGGFFLSQTLMMGLRVKELILLTINQRLENYCISQYVLVPILWQQS